MKGTRDGERVITKLVNGPKGYSAINPDDLDDVVHELTKLHGSSAILCRTNKEIAAVTAYLTSHDIDFITSKEVRLQKLIDCALSDEYTLGLFASYLNSNKYGEYIRLSATVKNPDLVWFLKLYGNVTQIKEDMKIINKLRSIAGSFGSTNSKLDEVAELLHLRSIKHADKEYLGIEFLKYLKTVISEVKSSELYVGTIHSVKGLEYDNVFVMNVGSYCFRLDSEEHKNLFYVAITRAKNRLFVYELFND